MKVLIVHPAFYMYGGGELVIKELCDYMRKHNIEHSILTSSMLANIRDYFRQTDVIIPMEIFERKKHVLNIFTKWINDRKKEYDVINYHNHPVHLISKNIQIPNVWQCNEPSPNVLEGKKVSELELDCVQNHINTIVVSDEYNANRVKIFYKRDSVIIPYGVDYSFFSLGDRISTRKKYSLDDKFVVLHVGPMHPAKNQLRSIEAVSRLRKEIPNIKLLLIGYDKFPYANQLRNLIKQNNLSQLVTIIPFSPRASLRNFYAAADVLLQPISDHGGWLVPIEALCTKTPIIVSSNATYSPIIQKNKLGIVTLKYEEDIKRIFDQQEYYKNRAKKASKWVKKNLTWNNYCKKMIKLFRDLQ